MIAMPDVNVLVALAWPNHVHHDVVHRWFRTAMKRGWATCPITQAGFVRVSSNTRAIPEAKTPAEANELLKELEALAGHEFWTDEVSVSGSALFDWERIVAYRQITDAHLLAVARVHGGRLATLDAGLASLLAESEAHAHLEILVAAVAG